MERYFSSVQLLNERFGVEGYFVPEQCSHLVRFLKEHTELQTICEIGFNVGMSSFMCLHARPDIEVVSFDIGMWSYVANQKQIIDEIFPNRHLLILGDSRTTLPVFGKRCPTLFDFCLVDGGHQGDVPYKDICNSLDLLKPGGWIYIDDVCEKEWAVDVVAGARKALDEGKIVEPIYFSNSERGWLLARKPQGSSTNPKPAGP
jgi:predicted O-methyltransferase YrrM